MAGAADLRNLSAEELADRAAAAKEELFNLRFQLATGQLDNTARVREVRREIARLQTVIREQEIEAYFAAVERAEGGE